MAKPLRFLFGDEELALGLHKVDRTKLYGIKSLEAVDEHDELCELATLADDGRTMIGRGGTGLGWIDADGNWCDKTKLKPIDVDGNEIQPVPSSFSAPIKLFDTATVEEYLQHNIRLVYVLSTEDGESSPIFDTLLHELRRGTIFSFPYSYRGGLEADAGFLLNNEDGDVMLAIGSPTDVTFVGLQSQIKASDEEAVEEDDVELMDFDMI